MLQIQNKNRLALILIILIFAGGSLVSFSFADEKPAIMQPRDLGIMYPHCGKLEKWFTNNKIEAIFKDTVKTRIYHDETIAKNWEAINFQTGINIEEIGGQLEDIEASGGDASEAYYWLNLAQEAYGVSKASFEARKKLGVRDWATCQIAFDNNPTGVVDGFSEFLSEQTAIELIKSGVKTDGKTSITERVDISNLGDEAVFYEIAGASGVFYYIQARKGPSIYWFIYFDKDARQQIEELIRDVTGPFPASSAPSSSPSLDQNKQPLISKISPDILPAGQFNYLTDGGLAIYKPYYVQIKIEGENLEGATLTTDNKGIIRTVNPQVIVFNKINIQNDGKVVYADTIINPTAKEGKTIITLTNKFGHSVTYQIDITITGTQYLQRKFSKTNIKFRGEWEEVAPNPRVLAIEASVNKGIEPIRKAPGYRNLGIVPIIYNSEYWNPTICGPDPKGASVTGCASPEETTINLKEGSELAETILHESAHKLHFYNLGIYIGVPQSLGKPTEFQNTWVKNTGQEIVSGKPIIKNCVFLPLKNTITWNDDRSLYPHCGFSQAYGASNITSFVEDVATMTEDYVFNHYLFFFPEAKKDVRYNAKINTLKNYGFLF